MLVCKPPSTNPVYRSVSSMLCQNKIKHLFHKLLKGSRHIHQPLNLYRPRWVHLGVLPSGSSHWQGPGAIEPFLPTTHPLPTGIPLPAEWQNTAALSASLGLDCLYGCDANLPYLKLFIWLPKVSIIPPVASAGGWPLVTPSIQLYLLALQFIPAGGPLALWSS